MRVIRSPPGKAAPRGGQTTRGRVRQEEGGRRGVEEVHGGEHGHLDRAVHLQDSHVPASSEHGTLRQEEGSRIYAILAASDEVIAAKLFRSGNIAHAGAEDSTGAGGSLDESRIRRAATAQEPVGLQGKDLQEDGRVIRCQPELYPYGRNVKFQVIL